MDLVSIILGQDESVTTYLVVHEPLVGDVFEHSAEEEQGNPEPRPNMGFFPVRLEVTAIREQV